MRPVSIHMRQCHRPGHICGWVQLVVTQRFFFNVVQGVLKALKSRKGWSAELRFSSLSCWLRGRCSSCFCACIGATVQGDLGWRADIVIGIMP